MPVTALACTHRRYRFSAAWSRAERDRGQAERQQRAGVPVRDRPVDDRLGEQRDRDLGDRRGARPRASGRAAESRAADTPGSRHSAASGVCSGAGPHAVCRVWACGSGPAGSEGIPWRLTAASPVLSFPPVFARWRDWVLGCRYGARTAPELGSSGCRYGAGWRRVGSSGCRHGTGWRRVGSSGRNGSGCAEWVAWLSDRRIATAGDSACQAGGRQGGPWSSQGRRCTRQFSWPPMTGGLRLVGLAAYRDGVTVICELAAQFSAAAWSGPDALRRLAGRRSGRAPALRRR